MCSSNIGLRPPLVPSSALAPRAAASFRPPAELCNACVEANGERHGKNCDGLQQLGLPQLSKTDPFSASTSSLTFREIAIRRPKAGWTIDVHTMTRWAHLQYLQERHVEGVDLASCSTAVARWRFAGNMNTLFVETTIAAEGSMVKA